MINKISTLSREEIIGNIEPAKLDRARDLRIRFQQIKVLALDKHEPLKLTVSGLPDIFAYKREDGYFSLKRVFLPGRHILLDEDVTYVPYTGLTMGPMSAEDTDYLPVELFLLDRQNSEKAVGFLRHRLPLFVIEKIQER